MSTVTRSASAETLGALLRDLALDGLKPQSEMESEAVAEGPAVAAERVDVAAGTEVMVEPKGPARHRHITGSVLSYQTGPWRALLNQLSGTVLDLEEPAVVQEAAESSVAEVAETVEAAVAVNAAPVATVARNPFARSWKQIMLQLAGQLPVEEDVLSEAAAETASAQTAAARAEDNPASRWFSPATNPKELTIADFVHEFTSSDTTARTHRAN